MSVSSHLAPHCPMFHRLAAFREQKVKVMVEVPNTLSHELLLKLLLSDVLVSTDSAFISNLYWKQCVYVQGQEQGIILVPDCIFREGSERHLRCGPLKQLNSLDNEDSQCWTPPEMDLGGGGSHLPCPEMDILLPILFPYFVLRFHQASSGWGWDWQGYICFWKIALMMKTKLSWYRESLSSPQHHHNEKNLMD